MTRSAEGARHPSVPMWWALGFSVLTVIGLGVLVWGLVVSHAMLYGFGSVFAEGAIDPVDPGRYRLAFFIGVVVALVSAAVLAWSSSRTGARNWPTPLRGFVAALLAAILGASGLLLSLGINPITFFLSPWG